MGVAACGLPHIRTSIQLMRLFSRATPVIPMTRWLEDRLGATIPLEVVLRFRPESGTAILDRMRVVAATHAQLRLLPSASGCLSAATFAPPEVHRAARGRFIRRAALNTQLENRREVLQKHGWIAQDGDDELWRISLRVRGIDDLDYAALVETIQSVIAPVHEAVLGPGRAGVDVIITGTSPIVFKARQSLLEGMLFGLGTDIALIVVGVILITRCWLTGGVMFLLSIFPTAIVFGSMGWLGVVVDIGSVMTPCVAVGVTVDDVIHFLLCHRRGVRQGMSVSRATLLAYATCGRAIFQSWAIIGVGLAAFALSSFVPTFRFGFLMLLLLTAGMLGNLLFLPALLSGPVGRWIVRGTRPQAVRRAEHAPSDWSRRTHKESRSSRSSRSPRSSL
jgi:predicted RND superfamily exporter protein